MFFEIDDIKRRHSAYYDTYNFHGWVEAPDSSIKFNFFRGALAGTIASTTQSLYNTYRRGYKILRRKYNQPHSLKQVVTMIQGMKQIPNFTTGLRRSLWYGAALGTFDVGTRLTIHRWFTEGLPAHYPAGDSDYWRRPLPIFFASILSSFFRAPMEIANKAFHAD